MEDITKQSKKRLLKNFVLTLGFLFVLAVVQFSLRNWIGISFYRYAVSAGPFLEEAFKGGAVFLIFTTVLLSNLPLKKKLGSKQAWLLGGALVGLGIALWEGFIEYSPGLHRVIPGINHIFWTAIVGWGIWLSMRANREWRLPSLVLPYGAVAISHITWNYYAYLEKVERQELTFGIISWVITLTTLFVIWRFSK